MPTLPSLLIDLGNTNLKWALYQAPDLAPPGRIPYDGLDLPGALDAIWGREPAPERAFIATVGNVATKQQIDDWVREHWGQQLIEVRSSTGACGVVNAYVDASRLGVDRWLCLIAVHRQTGAPACIVDCGSAVTVDALDANGQHLGGLILPGLEMMREALLRNTQIRAERPGGPPELLARDTESAIAAGGIFACAGLVGLVVRRITGQCGTVPEIVLTGGDGGKLRSVLEMDARYEPDLVLQGMAQLVGDMQP